MGFRSINFDHLAKFNSAVSSELIDKYEAEIKRSISERSLRPRAKTFAPSGFRCSRMMWFRLRGSPPDENQPIDISLDFIAKLGTACHEMIQSTLMNSLGDDWIDVRYYIENHLHPNYTYHLHQSGLETQIQVVDPPIQFACDGIIRLHDKFYLLEIKTAEFSSFNELTDPKSQHIDQIKCYATLLNLHDVLVLYQDRQYGSLKCYEMHVSDEDMNSVNDKFRYIQDIVSANIAPEGLPKGDIGCQRCIYFKRCKEWGR